MTETNMQTVHTDKAAINDGNMLFACLVVVCICSCAIFDVFSRFLLIL